jgi:hypothetical protein
MHGAHAHAQPGSGILPTLTRSPCVPCPRRRYSAIDFDYLEYHGLRMAEFRRRKDAVLAAAAAQQ